MEAKSHEGGLIGADDTPQHGLQGKGGAKSGLAT